MGWTRVFAAALLVGAATLATVEVPAAAALTGATTSPGPTALPMSNVSVSGSPSTAGDLQLKPASGPPGTAVVVVPEFGQATTCELDWDGRVLEPAFACGQTPDGFLTTVLQVPVAPGKHLVTACWPTCGRAVQVQSAVYTVTDPATPGTVSVGAPRGPSLSVSIPGSVLTTLARSTPVARPVVVSMSVMPLARPVAARGSPPYGLVGAVVGVLLLVSLGGGLFLRRRPRGRHDPLHGPLVVVTTYARARIVHTARTPPDSPHVGVTTRRGRAALVHHVRRRQEYRS